MRHFRALRHLTLPRDLIAGPGATNMQLDPGAVVTCEDANCVAQQRFINLRLAAGDLEELPEALPDAPAPKTVENASDRKVDTKLGQVVADVPTKKER